MVWKEFSLLRGTLRWRPLLLLVVLYGKVALAFPYRFLGCHLKCSLYQNTFFLSSLCKRLLLDWFESIYLDDCQGVGSLFSHV